MTSVRCIRLDTAGNRGFSGARIVPGADAWRERETSMRLDPDGWLVRRNIADATIMKTRMRLRSHIGGGVCLSERNEKKCQKLCKGDVLPLDRSLLMGDFSVVLLRSDFVLVSLRVQAFLILVVISLNSLITLGIILARFQQFTQAYHR
jgi:hypothetical protein